ncbi:hypothetical protein ACFX2I_028397 [Malus domestica]|uniref:F-box protein CPR1-like n=1 Tax=Malus domestica TaxID=3750 RepID=UPI0010A997E3|nr:F-box protein CPR1-like [Malus domestica]
MAEFPPELIFEILLRLPPEGLLRCLCVSKSWNATIHDKNFIKSHLQRSIQTNSFGSLYVYAGFYHDGRKLKFSTIYNDGTIEQATGIGQSPLQDVEGRIPFPYTLVSCNGIICIRTETVDKVEEFVLWNPSIQKFKNIPSPTFEQPPSSDIYLHRRYGFGYDSANDDYKLLGIAMFFVNWDLNISVHQYQIYSLKSNSWRKIKNMPRDEFQFSASEIVFLNGCLSWQAYNVLDKKFYVVTFELASEKYHWFPNPVNGIVYLEVLGDSLCIFRLRTTIDAWIMKEHGSWTLLYSIEQAAMRWVSRWKPVLLSKNGESVLLMNGLEKFAWFDFVKNSWKEVGTAGPYIHTIDTICMRSLCLLDGDPIIVESSKSLSL